MNTQEWKQRKNQLKTDICNYFRQRGADSKKLQEVADFIKAYGEFDEQSYQHKPIDDHVTENFSPPHREKICEFLNRWETLSEIDQKFIEKQRPGCWATDDFEYEDWLKTPEGRGEIVVYEHKITLESFYFIERFAPHHPSKKRLGKTPRGGYLWEYAREALPMLQKLGLPVLKSLSAADD